jgi:nitric oxide reductase
MHSLPVGCILILPNMCPCLPPSPQDPSLWPAAVDEICRYHTASSYALRRVALEDVKVGGTTIKYVAHVANKSIP